MWVKGGGKKMEIEMGIRSRGAAVGVGGEGD